MNLDLIFLSSRVALLVLLGSILAAIVGWLLRSWAARMERAHLMAKLDAEHVLRARLQEQLDQVKATTAAVSTEDKASEEQCVAALQQRDEAERQASEALNRVRGLQEQLERAQREASECESLRVKIADLQKSESELRAQLETVSASMKATASAVEVAAAPEPEKESDKQVPVEALTPKVLPTKLFAAPVVPILAPVMESAGDFEFPPAPVRPIEDIARHRAPLRAGAKPDAEKLSAIVAELRESASKAKAAEKRSVLDARVSFVVANLERLEQLSADPDDLTEIRGIKTGIQKQLLEVGVCTFDQVGAWSPKELDVIMNLPGIKQRPLKDKWQEQARELVEIKKWQREK